MSNRRYLPFGYIIKNGKTVIEPKEAEIIKNIFKSYIEGASLNDIALYLSKEPINAPWSKSKISRIIDNAKYIGDDEFEAIIDKKLYLIATELKNSHRINVASKQSPEITILKPYIRCAVCGSKMRRSVSKVCIIREGWTCENKDCRKTLRITDKELIDTITRLLNRFLENDAIQNNSPTHFDTKNIFISLYNELHGEYAKSTPDENQILRIIKQIAAQQYDSLKRKDISLHTFKTNTSSDTLNIEYLQQLVSEITLSVEGEIKLITKKLKGE